MNTQIIFNNNRNSINFIADTTSRVSVLVEDISYQFERQFGSNVIKCVGSNNSFEISTEQVNRLDQEFIVANECRTTRITKLTEFANTVVRCTKRKRPYDVLKEGDKEITSREVIELFRKLNCDHVFGNFYFTAHLADSLRIAHTGWNKYSENDTYAACIRIKNNPMTFEDVQKTLNVSKAHLDYALRKIELTTDLDEYRVTYSRGDIYPTPSFEMFSTKIIDLLMECSVDVAAEDLVYITLDEMCELVSLDAKDVFTKRAGLYKRGIRPSKRQRGNYLRVDGIATAEALNKFPYTADEVAAAAGITRAALCYYESTGIIPAESIQIVPGATFRKRYNADAMAKAVAKAQLGRSRRLTRTISVAEENYWAYGDTEA